MSLESPSGKPKSEIKMNFSLRSKDFPLQGDTEMSEDTKQCRKLNFKTLIGRENEKSMLENAVETVFLGEFTVLVVDGQPGMG